MKGVTVSAAIIVLLIVSLTFVSGCIATGECSFEKAPQKKVLEASSIKQCVDMCHSIGLLWRTQVEGLGPDRVKCNCYSCGA